MRVSGGTAEVTLAHTGTKLGAVKRQVGASDCSSRLCRRRMAELLAWTCNERALWAGDGSGSGSGSRAEVGRCCGVGPMGGDALLALRTIAKQRLGPQWAGGEGLAAGSGLSPAFPLLVPAAPQSVPVNGRPSIETTETVVTPVSEEISALGLAPAIARAQTYEWWKLADGPYREARAAFLRCEPFSGWRCDPLPVFRLEEAERKRERERKERGSVRGGSGAGGWYGGRRGGDKEGQNWVIEYSSVQYRKNRMIFTTRLTPSLSLAR